MTDNAATGQLDDLTVANNIINFPTGVAGLGIWLQCNNAGATCNNNTISGNHIISDGTSGSTSIQVGGTGASIQNNLVEGNNITGPSTGINLTTGTSYTIINGGVNTAATPITDNGSNNLPNYTHLTGKTANLAATTAFTTSATLGNSRFQVCAVVTATTIGTSWTVPSA